LVYFCTVLTAAEIYALIENRRSELGLSQAQLGQLAFGQSNSAAIQNLRRGSSPTADRLSALADALNLELYFGPRRDLTPAPSTTVSGEAFATVARYDAAGAAGDGVINLDGPPVDHLAFSKRWLEQNGISAGDSILINVRGDSMRPSLYDGDLVMIDRRKTQIRSGQIYVFREADALRIKRLEVIPDAAIILRSDNPEHPPEHRTGEAMNAVSQNIVGQVVWSGHKWG